ncbi:glycosyl transferase [Desulfococcaceae bacterium HSG8]|nr:glycosyl transferase [Desulfococcaceae bacterium HSG8]
MAYIIPCLSFFLCLILTPLVRYIAIRKDWIAYPRKERWHEKPTAMTGGIAIYLSMAVPLAFTADFSTILPHIIRSPDHIRLPSIEATAGIGMTLLFILGLLDDFIHIKPHTKLVGQILVASMVTFLGFRLHWFTSLTLDTIITIIWIVGITNAFNLIDNMDGLCAGIGAIAALYLGLLFIGDFQSPGNPDGAGLVAILLAGALIAFLFYNFNPASIFMGDCGSLMIGFTLSMLTLYYSESATAGKLSSCAVPIMILMIPVLDTTMVTLIRLLSGRKASVGGKDHTSHRLVLMGFSEKGAVLSLYGIGAVSGVAALFVSRTDTLTSPAVIIPLALSILLMGIYLAQIRVYPEKEFSLLRGRPYTPVLIELTYKRQIVLVLLDFCLIAFAYYLSYRLRFDDKAFPFYFKVFLHSLPAVIACKFVAFFTMGIYRGIWQYMSTNDVFVYLKASLLATLLSVATITFIYQFEDFLKGIFVIDWLLTTALLLGTRGSFRISIDTMKRKTLSGNTVFIYGAGRGGEILLREILNNGKHKIKPVGFIDDDPLKIGKKLMGYPILGDFGEVESLFEKYRISGMLISFNSRESRNIDALKRFCRINSLFLKWFFIDLEDVDIEDTRH